MHAQRVAAAVSIDQLLGSDGLIRRPAVCEQRGALLPLTPSRQECTAVSLNCQIRDARAGDLLALTEIVNAVIASSTAIFSDAPVTVADRLDWWRARSAQGHPVLVAEDPSGVIGFSTFGDFRSWPGYRFTVEHSVHVRADRRGRGVGHQLVEALFPRARALGKHMMVAGIDAANDPSIRFHERLGFVRAGLLREVGFKFGQWLDLVFMQRRLD